MEHDQTSLFVRRAVKGETEGVEWIVAHFQPMVEALVRVRLRGQGRPQDIEDLAADVWIVTLGNLESLRPREGRLAPVLVKFLGTTVLQTCNNFLRRRIRQAATGGRGGEPGMAAVDQLPADTMGVVTRAVQHDLGSLVRACLEQLSADKRDVLVLRLMEHRTNQEIGKLLGIPANTVAVRYRRAIEELREQLPAEIFAEITAVAS